MIPTALRNESAMPICGQLPNPRRGSGRCIPTGHNRKPWVFSGMLSTRELERRLQFVRRMILTPRKEDEMERTFLLPNGIQAGVRTTTPVSNSSTVRFGKDVPILFYVSNAEATKKVLCRFAELSREEREGIC